MIFGASCIILGMFPLVLAGGDSLGWMLEDFWMFFGTSWLTLSMFSVALAGGATPPQTPPILNGLVGLL